MSHGVDIVPAEGDLAEALVRAAQIPFSFETDEAEMERIVSSLEPGRFFVPMDGGKAVGSGGSWRYEVTVPGGARLETAGITFVTVLPTHRRRGVLRKMMRRIVDDAHERGEPLAALWASEATIYGRFGFGQAVEMVHWELDSRRADWRLERPVGSPQLIDHEEARVVVPPLHDAACVRHGMFGRSDHLWDTWSLADESWMRDGHSPRRIVLWIGEDGPEGYAFFRTKLSGTPSQVRVEELHGLTPAAYRGLVGFAADVDLTERVRFSTRPVDETMRWMLRDSRALSRVEGEFVWFALLDLPRALAARSYGADGELVLDVGDPFCAWNEGRWLLSVDGGAAACARTSREPDVALDSSDLGALYMGGRSASTLAAAGRIRGSEEAVVRLERMFRTLAAPSSPEHF